MTYEEVIENLKYLISDDCTDTQHDFVEEIKIAIDALEKQIPKKPTNFAIENNDGYTIYDCECPICEQSHRELFPFAFCIHCGQALEWEK